jgi:hypothetical protein
MTKDEALRMALEALELVRWTNNPQVDEAITAIKQALAAPVQEHVGYITQARCFVHLHEYTEAEAKLYGWKALYTTPPAAQPAVPLTDEQIDDEHDKLFPPTIIPGARARVREFARAIEAKLKEKNT